eukprot:16316061-Heterocapsa_arctica.AAC.1
MPRKSSEPTERGRAASTLRGWRKSCCSPLPTVSSPNASAPSLTLHFLHLMHHVFLPQFVLRHIVHFQSPLRHLPVGSPQAQKVALANTHSPHRHQESSKPGGWAKPPLASDIHLANPPARAAIWPCGMDPCSAAIASRNCLNVSPSVPSK